MAKLPRWLLYTAVHLLRILSNLGFVLHHIPFPRARLPSSRRSIQSRSSHRINLVIYSPCASSSRTDREPKRCVIHFHGGGFIVGAPTNNGRWCQLINDRLDAVVVSVDYRMAPGYPFPAAVEDGTDAILYVMRHAEEFGIDPRKIVLSGFSAGGNLVLTTALMLKDLQERQMRAEKHDLNPGAIYDLAGLMCWYPVTDYTIPRSRRHTCSPRPEKHLPMFLIDMFYDSYVYPADQDLSNPYLSPGLAPDDMLQKLPETVLVYTCEYDLFQPEGEQLAKRLQALGKKVFYHNMSGVRHGYDHMPNAFSWPAHAGVYYADACEKLEPVFEGR